MESSHSAAGTGSIQTEARSRSRASGRVIVVAVAFALTAVFALASAQPAFADYSAPYTYTVYPDHTVGLDKCDPDAAGTLNIPSTLGGYPVTFIDHGAFFNCTEITTVTIPAGVTDVAFNSFMYCTNLKSISFPNTITALGDGVFAYCSHLTSVDLPDGLTTLQSGMFDHCSALSTVDIPGRCTSIGSFAFQSCTSLSTITIPPSVSDVGQEAFKSSGVHAAWFRGDAPTIGTDAFAGTPAGLTIYVIPGNASWGTVPGTWNGYTTAPWPVYTITPVAGVHGHVTASGPATGVAGFNTTVTITPDAGYHIVNVTLDGVSQGAIASYRLNNVLGSHTISATFGANVVSTITRLSGSSSVRRNTTLKLSGTVSPGGPGRVTITMKRKVGRTWRSAGSVRATVVNGAYRCSVKLAYRGSWRMVAVYAGGVSGPTTYRRSTSSTKSVTVR